MILTQAEGIGIGRDVDVARNLYDRGDYQDAYALAMRAFKDSADVDIKLRALLTASSSRSEQKKYADALTILNRACSFVDDVAPTQKAKFFGQRAFLHAKLKDDANVLIDYEAARVYAQEAADKVLEAQIVNNLAGCYRRLQRFEESITESDAAIAIVRSSGDRLWLARFYDQKAQTLIEMGRCAEAVAVSKKAVDMLGDHPAGSEARATHGRALIALGASYLETDDPVESFGAKRRAVKSIDQAPSRELMQLALDRVGGRVAPAAQLLGISYPTLIESIERHGLSRQKPYRRGKSLHSKKTLPEH